MIRQICLSICLSKYICLSGNLPDCFQSIYLYAVCLYVNCCLSVFICLFVYIYVYNSSPATQNHPDFIAFCLSNLVRVILPRMICKACLRKSSSVSNCCAVMVGQVLASLQCGGICRLLQV